MLDFLRMVAFPFCYFGYYGASHIRLRLLIVIESGYLPRQSYHTVAVSVVKQVLARLFGRQLSLRER